MAEIQAALDSDLLTENRQGTVHAQDPDRYRLDNMKGLSATEKYASRALLAASDSETVIHAMRQTGLHTQAPGRGGRGRGPAP